MRRRTLVLVVIIVALAITAPALYLQLEERTIKASASEVVERSGLLPAGWILVEQEYFVGEAGASWDYQSYLHNNTVLQSNLTMNVFCHPTVQEAKEGYGIMGGNDHNPRLPDNLSMGDQGLFREQRGYDPYVNGTEFVRGVGSYYMVRVSNVVLTMTFTYQREQGSPAPEFDAPWMREPVASKVAVLESHLTSNALF